ncbi:hypothetical protein [Streptomyces scabiei]|uniref:hypothetical protein n=1 Tax=Streptomyces scabiei TaxID=1930 RepID=UPI0029B40971|nr:hypothetical protein [Streptomyces scabiei]MDX3520248.1 hypothetical protein [Streptomyces scabiei]
MPVHLSPGCAPVFSRAPARPCHAGLGRGTFLVLGQPDVVDGEVTSTTSGPATVESVPGVAPTGTGRLAALRALLVRAGHRDEPPAGVHR